MRLSVHARTGRSASTYQFSLECVLSAFSYGHRVCILHPDKKKKGGGKLCLDLKHEHGYEQGSVIALLLLVGEIKPATLTLA